MQVPDAAADTGATNTMLGAFGVATRLSVAIHLLFAEVLANASAILVFHSPALIWRTPSQAHSHYKITSSRVMMQ
jgi:uncharacterized membrane protein YgdD (TMEM256/DUF423 family)